MKCTTGSRELIITVRFLIANSYRKTRCPARAQTENDFVIKTLHNHSHVPDLATIKAKQIRSEVKLKALEAPQEAPRKIIGKLLSNVETPVLVKLPPVTQLAQSVSRYRKSLFGGKRNPRCLAELVISEEMTRTAKGEHFILYDDNGHDSRLIIFGTQANLEFLSACPDWFMDGTFKIAPSLFNQLYTIHGT